MNDSKVFIDTSPIIYLLYWIMLELSAGKSYVIRIYRGRIFRKRNSFSFASIDNDENFALKTKDIFSWLKGRNKKFGYVKAIQRNPLCYSGGMGFIKNEEFCLCTKWRWRRGY